MRNFTSCTTILLTSHSSISPLSPAATSQRKIKKKIKPKQNMQTDKKKKKNTKQKNKQNKQKAICVSLPFLPVQPSSILIALRTAVCHTVYSFVQSLFLTNVHCNESLLAWFKVSGFWYNHHHCILSEAPLGYPMATPSHEDSLNIMPQDQFFHKLQQLLDRIDVRVAQLQAKLWACGVVELVSPDH